ncbi:MAG TPA: hypothetical protein VHF87_05105 [Methylomirabilota bacterium]|nr:hypothetical protein [Methylomirabilota bacterium]
MSAAEPRGRRTTSQNRVLDNLRIASRKGDRTALALALDEMRTLAFTPRYWLRYLTLIQHPLARIVDLLVIKQGDRIARQKGWSPTGRPARRRPAPARPAKAPRPRRPARPRSGPEQAPLFPGL